MKTSFSIAMYGQTLKVERETKIVDKADQTQTITWRCDGKFEMTEIWSSLSGTFDGESVSMDTNPDDYDTPQIARQVFDALERMNTALMYLVDEPDDPIGNPSDFV